MHGRYPLLHMSIKFTTILFFSCLTTFVNAQALFPEVYKGCNTATMTLESDTATITKEPKEIANLLIDNISEQVMRKLAGRITMQIIVYSDGSNCVFSIENESNIDSKELNLKPIFDNNLSWNTHDQLPISVLIELDFNKGKLNYRRLGVSTEKGLHELYNAGRPE